MTTSSDTKVGKDRKFNQNENYIRITKYDRDGLQGAIGLEITKYERAGLQIAISFELQSATKILKNGLQSAMGLQSVTDYRCQLTLSLMQWGGVFWFQIITSAIEGNYLKVLQLLILTYFLILTNLWQMLWPGPRVTLKTI